jgi:chloramphenicol 3-O-phosphotransferase
VAVERGFVIVSGPPGAGKSSLAVPLAQSLGLPLLRKDHIKETLHDHLPAHGEARDWSRSLGGASMELIWALTQVFPAAVLEANFRPDSAYERKKLAALPAPLVEVYCRCPLDLAAERYNRRFRAPGHHPTHVLAQVSVEMLGEFDHPVALGPVIEADTTAPVDVVAIAARVHDALSALIQTT